VTLSDADSGNRAYVLRSVSRTRKDNAAGTAGRADDGLLNYIAYEYRCRAIIEHKKFGTGRVAKIEENPTPINQVLTVAFDDGSIKKLNTRWAPITWSTRPDRVPRRYIYCTQAASPREIAS
jgi:hypothetical protein